MCWNEQVSRDFEGSKAFYAAVFDYEYGDMSGDGFSYATVNVDGRYVGGIGDLHAGVLADTPPAWRVYFGTADTDVSVARVQANGGSVIREPIDHPYGRMSTVADDQGAVFRCSRHARVKRRGRCSGPRLIGARPRVLSPHADLST